MRIGLYVSPAGAGSMDEVLARFARAEALGFHTAWSGQVFAHDVAVVGNGAAIDAGLDALASLGVSDFSAVTFPVPAIRT